MNYVPPIRYSGYRISLAPPDQQHDMWVTRLTDINFLLPHIQEALKEPYFVDDSYIDMPFDTLLRAILESGEVFACFDADHTGERTLCGFVLLRDVRPGRDAWLEAYSLPQYRGGYPAGRRHINQIMEYCFAPWNPEQLPSQKLSPKGLGLRKLKASVSAMNTPACTALKRMGFVACGFSPADGLFKGQLTDIITVEKINPALLPKEPHYAQRRGEAASGTESDTSTAVPVGTSMERPERESEGGTDRQLRAAGSELAASGGGSSRQRGIPGT
jgi:RimJ/RimL family protein N-acetyltransferase